VAHAVCLPADGRAGKDRFLNLPFLTKKARKAAPKKPYNLTVRFVRSVEDIFFYTAGSFFFLA
jgi:hypothetical protein